MVDFEDERVKVWTFTSLGEKRSMEDQHFVSTDLPGDRTLIGVFDGHGGAETARFCSRVFTRYLLANPAYSSGDFATALHETFMQMDRLLRGSRELLHNLAIPRDEKGIPVSTGEEDIEIDIDLCIDYGMIKEERGFGGYGEVDANRSGTTATVALVLDKSVIIANAGDSFCCLVRDGNVVSLTVDHSKGLQGDDLRAMNAGGVYVRATYLYTRIGGLYGLNMTRCLGDIPFKLNKDLGFEHQVLSPVPDIVELDLTRTDQYLMLATDGIHRSYIHNWQQIVNMCEKKESGEMYRFCPPSTHNIVADNCTLLVVKLKRAGECGEDDDTPAKRFSWYTQNNIEGYEAENVYMRPWQGRWIYSDSDSD